MDFDGIKVGENFIKLFFLKNSQKEIIFSTNNRNLMIAKVDNSNKLKEKSSLFLKNFKRKGYQELIDFVPISDSKLCIIYYESKEGQNAKTMLLIKSLTDRYFYEYKIADGPSKVMFFKEKKQLIIENNNFLYFLKFIKNIQKYQLFAKIF